jgi:AsmA protein
MRNAWGPAAPTNGLPFEACFATIVPSGSARKTPHGWQPGECEFHMANTNSSSASQLGFPIWAKIILALTVVLVLIALAVPYFLNVDRYRDTIADAIAKQTGRKVTMGKIRARLLPGAGLTVDELHVGNPEGFPQGDLLSADEIRVNVALSPLLHRTIHVNSIDLVHPMLSLITDSNGNNNYTFTPSPSGQTAVAASGKAPAPTEGQSSVSLDEVDNINLTGAEVLVGSVVRGAVLSGADTKGINITLHNFVVTPMRVHDWQADSKLSGVTLTLEGWTDPVAFRSGEITLSGGKMDAQFVADLAKASDIKGTLSIPDVEKPQVNFEMSASELDIDQLIATAGGQTSGTYTAPAKPKAGPPTKGPSEMIARGHINVEKITTKPYTVGPANVEIRVYTDRAELWPISIGMYGGTLQISSRVDRATDPPRFTANVQMRNLDVAKVLAVTPSANGKMGGTGELDLQLLGSLSNEWKKTLSGTGKFAVRNGHLPGVNLNSIAGSLAKLAGVGGDTPFTVLEGDVTIANQRVTSKLIHLDSSSGVVDLKGSVGMDSTLDYQGTAALNPTAALGAVGSVVGGMFGKGGGKITVPFGLGGTIESPKVKPGGGMSIASGSASPAAPLSKTGVTPDDVNTIKNLFKKH